MQWKTVLAVWLCCLSAPALAQEQIAFERLAGFALAYEAGTPDRFIREYVPEGETVERWSQMQTHQRCPTLAGEDPVAAGHREVGHPQLRRERVLAPIGRTVASALAQGGAVDHHERGGGHGVLLEAVRTSWHCAHVVWAAGRQGGTTAGRKGGTTGRTTSRVGDGSV